MSLREQALRKRKVQALAREKAQVILPVAAAVHRLKEQMNQEENQSQRQTEQVILSQKAQEAVIHRAVPKLMEIIKEQVHRRQKVREIQRRHL